MWAVCRTICILHEGGLCSSVEVRIAAFRMIPHLRLCLMVTSACPCGTVSEVSSVPAVLGGVPAILGASMVEFVNPYNFVPLPGKVIRRSPGGTGPKRIH